MYLLNTIQCHKCQVSGHKSLGLLFEEVAEVVEVIKVVEVVEVIEVIEVVEVVEVDEVVEVGRSGRQVMEKWKKLCQNLMIFFT